MNAQRLAIKQTVARLYAVCIVQMAGDDLREIPLHALRTRRQIDMLLARGLTVKAQLAERVW